MKNFFLNLSGVLYGLIAAVHVVRFYREWPVTIASYSIPIQASLWAFFVFLLFSLGCFLAASKK